METMMMSSFPDAFQTVETYMSLERFHPMPPEKNKSHSRSAPSVVTPNQRMSTVLQPETWVHMESYADSEREQFSGCPD